MVAIGFVGLGVMGLPMARNLLKGGHAVKGFDLDADRVARHVANGGTGAASAAAAAEGADVLFTMLPRGEHVQAALLGEGGAAAALARGAQVVEMSTILPAESDAIRRDLAALGLAMVDAPVGRSSKHAESGQLLIMAGGDDADLATARPLLELLGDPIVHCGAGGAGARMKVVNNYLSIALNVLTAETLTLAEGAGLDRDMAIGVLKQTAAGMGHLGTTYPAQVLKGDLEPGFMIEHAQKDMGLALAMAAGSNAPVLLGAAAQQVLTIAKAEGRARQDWTAVLETVRGLAGLEG